MPPPPRNPADQVEAGRAFFSGLDLEVGHFAAVWHLLKVGERLTTELNTISARHGLSLADFHLLSALMIDHPTPLRATDLTHALHVTNATLSTRVARLARRGMLVRAANANDQRAIMLHLTDAGATKVREVGVALERESAFVAHFRRMDENDRTALGRIAGDLHHRLLRDFVPTTRPLL